MYKIDKALFNKETVNKIQYYLEHVLRFSYNNKDPKHIIYSIDLNDTDITFKIPKNIDYNKDVDRAFISFQLESLARAYSRDSKDMFDEIINY